MIGRRKLSHLVLGVVAMLTAAPDVAHAGLEGAIGKPLPVPELADGTVMVRVLAGEVTAPVANVEVTLIGSGAPRVATTNSDGRVTFDQIPAGATVKVVVTPTVVGGTSESFTMPATGGFRLLLTTVPWIVAAAPPLPRPRMLSGQWRPDDAEPPGTAAVRLTYDDLAEPRPPAGVSVALVG